MYGHNLGSVRHIDEVHLETSDARADDDAKGKKSARRQRRLKRAREASEAATRMENEKEALQARVTTLEALCFERFEEEDDGDVAPLEELGTLKLQPVDAMYEAASSSFYFRCTCGLLYGHANVLPDPGAFLLPCLFIMLQIASLNTVWQATWFSWYASAANYDEELYSEAGLPYPSKWIGMTGDVSNGDKVFGVVLIVAVPLVFCSINVFFCTRSELTQAKAGFILTRQYMNDLLRREGQPDPRAVARVFFAQVLWYMRYTLVWYYLDISGQMLGWADGPVNLLLNSIALCFIFDFDDMINFDRPNSNAFLWAKDPREVKHKEACNRRARDGLRAAIHNYATAPAWLGRVASATNWLSELVVTALLFYLSLKIQAWTNEGRFVSVDDDVPIMGSNGHQPYLHRVYKAILYSIGALLLLDSHVTVAIAEARWRHWAVEVAERTLFLAFDIFVIILIREYVIKYVLSLLFFFNGSVKTEGDFDFLGAFDISPSRVEPYYYEDDAAAYEYQPGG